mmetsp:Transcript_9218/g.28045  ORF Transcript_9218/g.28045 Transcript_9218/m.28045 type:complete len:140 (-) Transcript_9218:74-493(-)
MQQPGTGREARMLLLNIFSGLHVLVFLPMVVLHMNIHPCRMHLQLRHQWCSSGLLTCQQHSMSNSMVETGCRMHKSLFNHLFAPSTCPCMPGFVHRQKMSYIMLVVLTISQSHTQSYREQIPHLYEFVNRMPWRVFCYK